jgi:hypothetical protein
MGWFAMTFSIAAVIAPTFGGAVYQANRHLLWYLSIVLGIIVLGGFGWLSVLLRKESQLAGQQQPQGAASRG